MSAGRPLWTGRPNCGALVHVVCGVPVYCRDAKETSQTHISKSMCSNLSEFSALSRSMGAVIGLAWDVL